MLRQILKLLGIKGSAAQTLTSAVGKAGADALKNSARNQAIGEVVETAAERLDVDDDIKRTTGNRDISDTVNRAVRSGDVSDLLRHVDASRFVTDLLSQQLIEQIMRYIVKNGQLNLPDGLLPDAISTQLEDALKNNNPDQLPTDRLTPDMVNRLTNFFDNDAAN